MKVIDRGIKYAKGIGILYDYDPNSPCRCLPPWTELCMVWVFPKKKSEPPRYQCEALWKNCKFWDLSQDNWLDFDPKTEELGYLELSCRINRKVDIFPLLDKFKEYLGFLEFQNKIIVFEANRKSFCLGIQSSEYQTLPVALDGIYLDGVWDLTALVLGSPIRSERPSSESAEEIEASIKKLIRVIELHRHYWRGHEYRSPFEIKS